jgi:hypothetical protein
VFVATCPKSDPVRRTLNQAHFHSWVETFCKQLSEHRLRLILDVHDAQRLVQLGGN